MADIIKCNKFACMLNVFKKKPKHITKHKQMGLSQAWSNHDKAICLTFIELTLIGSTDPFR